MRCNVVPCGTQAAGNHLLASSSQVQAARRAAQASPVQAARTNLYKTHDGAMHTSCLQHSCTGGNMTSRVLWGSGTSMRVMPAAAAAAAARAALPPLARSSCGMVAWARAVAPGVPFPTWCGGLPLPAPCQPACCCRCYGRSSRAAPRGLRSGWGVRRNVRCTPSEREAMMGSGPNVVSWSECAPTPCASHTKSAIRRARSGLFKRDCAEAWL